MNNIAEKLDNCYDELKKITDFKPKTALVLGSGLGGFADRVKACKVVEYGEIKNFPVSTVSGHSGRFIFGYVEETPVVVMQGRVHYYEGYDISDVVLPIRVMRMMGAENLILTNAAGGINKSFKPGDLMMITGQISSFVPSVLRGENISALGERFPDMSCIYNEQLQSVIRTAAKKVGVEIKEGVYVQTQGPNYESPEEIKMFSILGADAVGMSTACEAIAARHAGMKVCGISCISNMAAGISKNELSHAEVKATADAVADNFNKLVYEVTSSVR